jgi:hypothetical protein
VQAKLWRLATEALIDGAGVALAYIAQGLSGTDFGPYGPLVAGVLAALANAVHKLLVPSEKSQ